MARHRIRGKFSLLLFPHKPLTVPQVEPSHTPSKAPPPTVDISERGTFKFTDVMNNLRHVYPQQQLSDISTSFGFICLLHLANEKGLVIENQEGFEELICRKDDSFNAADNV